MTMFGECCCCVSLSTGTKAIGIVYTIIAGLMAVVYTIPLLITDSLTLTRTVSYGIIAGVSAVQCVLGVVMIVGAFKKNPKCLWPWILVAWACGLSLLVLCVVGAVLLYHTETPSTPDFMGVMVYYFVYGLSLLYFGLVVKSRADEIAWDQTYLRKRMRYTDIRAMSTRLYS